MPILDCANCRAKNRVSRFRLNARATCGRCGAFLAEPHWLLLARQAKKYWPAVAGGAFLLAYYGYKPEGSPRMIAPEPAWSSSQGQLERKAVPASVPSLSPPLEIQTDRRKVQPPRIPLPITCVPVAIRSGSSKAYSRDPRVAPLQISTPDDGNYLIKLVKAGTKTVVLSAYIAGGDTRKFRVPLGSYAIYYAQGRIWCGDKEAFGRSNTHLMRLVGTFDFTKDSDGYAGVGIELTKQVGGNLRSEEVSDAEFSELLPGSSGGGARTAAGKGSGSFIPTLRR